MNPLRQLLQWLGVCAGLVLLSPAVQAHSDEYLDRQGGIHGGIMRMSGPYHLELVLARGRAEIWLMDHANQPQPVAGGRGQLTLFQAGERLTLDLQPEGENRMLSEDPRIQPSDTPRALLTLSLRGQSPLQVRFARLRGEADKDAHHHAH